METPRLFLGCTSSNKLLRVDANRTDDGQAYTLLARTDRVAPASVSGECAFHKVFVPIDHDGACTIRVTPIIDGKPLDASEYALPAPTERTVSLIEVPIVIKFPSSITNFATLAGFAPRGVWYQTQIETVGTTDAYVAALGNELEYEVVRKVVIPNVGTAPVVIPPAEAGPVFAAYLSQRQWWKDLAKTVPGVGLDHIRVWGDYYGSGRDAVTRYDSADPTFTLIPQVQDGGIAVRFGDPAYTNGAFIGPTTKRGAYTIPHTTGFLAGGLMVCFKLAQVPFDDVWGPNIFQIGEQSNDSTYVYKASDNHLWSTFGSARNYDLGLAPSHHFLDRYHILRFESTATYWRCWLDNVLIHEDTTGPLMGWDQTAPVFGENVLGAMFNGFIKHLVIYNDVLTTAQADGWYAFMSGATSVPPHA